MTYNHKEYMKKYNKIHSVRLRQWSKDHNFSQRQVLFRNRKLHAPNVPRIGICNWCCAVVGVNCKQTQLHHIEYHDEDILKDTIELCASCHAYETWRVRKWGT